MNNYQPQENNMQYSLHNCPFFCEGKNDGLTSGQGGFPVANVWPGPCAAQELVNSSQALDIPSPHLLSETKPGLWWQLESEAACSVIMC